MIEHLFVILAFGHSDHLEACIKSVLAQKHDKDCRINIVIATSTPNAHIRTLSHKYNLDIKTNNGKKGISADFDFALSCAMNSTNLLTIAHQDDIYDPTYSLEIVKAFKRHKDSLIVFTDYYEIRNNKKVFSNSILRLKRILLIPLKITSGKMQFIKRSALRFGNAICCPAVTFNTKKVHSPLFESHFKCDVDWHAWEKLSRQEGNFTFISKKLMGHRIHQESTTTSIIGDNLRIKEDEEMFCRFWSTPVARLFTKIYATSEKSNKLEPDK